MIHSSSTTTIRDKRPGFISSQLFRSYMTSSNLNKLFRVDNITPAAYIQRCIRLGKPIRNKRGMYRPIDIWARSKAEMVDFGPSDAIRLNADVDSLRSEIESLRHARDELRAVMALARHIGAAGEYFHEYKNKRLWSEKEVVEAAVPYTNFCGIYFLINNDRVIYIGQSVNVSARVSQHTTTNKVFDKWLVLPCKKEHLDVMESLYIHLLRPPGNGCNHGAMIAPMTLEGILEPFTNPSLRSRAYGRHDA